MCKCLECGEVFQDSSLVIEKWEESRGEFWGIPCTETMYEVHCPYCDSEDVEENYVEEEDDDSDI